MKDINVWLPLACAGAGFMMGGLIGFGMDKMRRRSLYNQARVAQKCATAMVDSCREVLSDAWFEKVRRNFMKKIRAGGIAV